MKGPTGYVDNRTEEEKKAASDRIAAQMAQNAKEAQDRANAFYDRKQAEKEGKK